MTVINNDWINSTKLKDRSYLSTVTAGVHVMTADGVPGLCRSGVIGIQHQKNSAWKRLTQLKNGNLKNEGPWQFIFLAPLPTDLGHDLRVAELKLQEALARNFDVGKKAQFRSTDWPKIQAVAADATQTFMHSMVRTDTLELEQALESYLAAVASGDPIHATPRASVLRSFRMALNRPLAERLLATIRAEELNEAQLAA